jgi:hypothetical protein
MTTLDSTPEILDLAHRFSKDEQDAIAIQVGVSTAHPAFAPFLGISQYLGLSPLLGEIFLIETSVFDRGSGQWTETLRSGVGRDGFLKVARRDKNFRTVRSGVVCAKDEFSFTDDGEQVTINHSVSLTHEEHEGEEPAAEAEIRGSVLGAWAKCFYRDNTAPFFYYAPISEHGKKAPVAGLDGAEAGGEDWLGAWSYTSAMIGKCAQSYVLRLGVSITGVVPVDEIRGGASSLTEGVRPRSSQPSPPQDNEAIVMGLDISEATKERLIEALGKINELSPFSWATAKVSIVLQGASEETAQAVLGEIEKEIESLSRDRS